jgi:hypothetical protein
MRQLAHPPVHVPSLSVPAHRGFALLALIVVLAFAATATVLIADDGGSSTSVAPEPRISEVTGGRTLVPSPVSRYDGGPNEGTAGSRVSPLSSSAPRSRTGPSPAVPATAPAQRYDGGPEEGTAGPFAGR